MEKYRLQIAFDIKDDRNRSVLDKGTTNTTSRFIRKEALTEAQITTINVAIAKVLSLCEEEPKFRNLFCVKMPDILSITNNGKCEEYEEIHAEHQRYRSLIHNKADNHLIPFVNKELWINRDVFSKSRLLLRKIRYYIACVCELIRL